MAARLSRKAFLRSTALRWVLLGLYTLLLLVTLWAALLNPDDDNRLLLVGYLALLGCAQALFIFTPGVRDLVRPVKKKRRLFWPVIIAGAMLAVLVFSFVLSMRELFRWSGFSDSICLLVILASWTGWSIFFFLHTRKMGRFKAFKRMTNFILCGSLLELLGCIPAHIVVSRRPGCLVGLETGMAVTAGVGVMLWAFGPGIAILFLAPKHEREAEGAASGGPIESAPLKRWNFSLGSLAVLVLLLGSVMAALTTAREPDEGLLEIALRPEAWCVIVFSTWFTVRLLKRLWRWEKEE